MITTTIETITPETAKNYLTLNAPQQRTVRKAWVKSLSKMIKDGDFMVTHQGIAFDDQGRVIDGQHRLHAIVDAGQAVQMMVARNVPSDVWHATDQGVVRTSKEVTGLERRSAEAARFIARMVYNEIRPSSKLLIQISSSPLGAKVEEIRSFAPSLTRYFCQAPMLVIAALRDLMGQTDYAKNQYRALSVQDFDSMSAISKALCRQVVTGSAEKSGTDMLCRAWKVFDPACASLSKIQIGEEYSKSTLAEIRQHMAHYIQTF